MTANLKRWDPNGTHLADVAVSGTPLATVIKAGTGSLKYRTDAGANRGNDIGARVTSPIDTDQANAHLTTTAAAGASIQAYIRFAVWPTVATAPFIWIRSSTANLILFSVTTAGALLVQNAAGSTVSTLYSMALNTWYRVELSVLPGTGTTDGQGFAKIYSDADVQLASWGPITNGNFGITQPATVRVGDASVAVGGPQSTSFDFTQLAVDTAATPPTILPVDTIVIPPPVVGNYDLVWDGTAWS